MSSRKFVLGESSKKDVIVRCLLVLIMLGVIAIAVVVGFYAFKSIDEEFGGCKQPQLDPFGMSNWTNGAETVAFGCFPGHQIEGHDDVVVSQCIDNVWVPPSPACAALPIALECQVNQNGLHGTISMWQNTNSTPTFIHGFLNTSDVDKEQIILMESIELSRMVCVAFTENINHTMPEPTPPESLENELEIRFNSTKLLGYKKAELRITMIFIDIPSNLTALIISLHQGSETLVMKSPVLTPGSTTNWSYDDSPSDTQYENDSSDNAIDGHGQNGKEVAEKVEKAEQDGSSINNESIPERKDSKNNKQRNKHGAKPKETTITEPTRKDIINNTQTIKSIISTSTSIL